MALSSPTPSAEAPTAADTVASAAAFLLLSCIVTLVVTIIAAAVTAPEPLLAPPEPWHESVGVAAVPVPSLQMNEIIEFKVRKRDSETITPTLTRVIEAQGGYRLPPLSEDFEHYLVTEPTGKWLAAIDADNGKDAYAALGNPPFTGDGTTSELASVQVKIEAPFLQRPLFARIYLATALAALVGLVAGLIASSHKPDPCST